MIQFVAKPSFAGNHTFMTSDNVVVNSSCFISHNFFLRKGDLKCTKEDLIDMNLTLNTDTWAGGIVTTDLLPQVTLIFVKYHE